MSLNIGDRVRVTGYNSNHLDFAEFHGQLGTWTGGGVILDKDPAGHRQRLFTASELTKVDAPPPVPSDNKLGGLVALLLKEVLDAAGEKFQANAVAHGFQTENRNGGEMLCLIHAEVSEMLEELRRVEPKQSEKIPEFTALEDEAADTFIRLVQFSVQHKLRLAQAVVAKHNYNTTRPYKHGKKF